LFSLVFLRTVMSSGISTLIRRPPPTLRVAVADGEPLGCAGLEQLQLGVGHLGHVAAGEVDEVRLALVTPDEDW
jgi:hypothetical protein